MENIVYQRIKDLCKERGITMTKLVDELGISESLIRKWKSTSSPSIDKLRLIAKYFGVTVDYLIGLSDIPESAEKIVNDADIISLQRAKSKMSQDDRERMMRMLRATFDKAFED